MSRFVGLLVLNLFAFGTVNLSADEAYAVEQIPVPANVVLEVSGMDYAPDGTLYLCTRRGDVWTISREGVWKRFAWLA